MRHPPPPRCARCGWGAPVAPAQPVITHRSFAQSIHLQCSSARSAMAEAVFAWLRAYWILYRPAAGFPLTIRFRLHPRNTPESYSGTSTGRRELALNAFQIHPISANKDSDALKIADSEVLRTSLCLLADEVSRKDQKSEQKKRCEFNGWPSCYPWGDWILKARKRGRTQASIA